MLLVLQIELPLTFSHPLRVNCTFHTLHRRGGGFVPSTLGAHPVQQRRCRNNVYHARAKPAEGNDNSNYERTTMGVYRWAAT